MKTEEHYQRFGGPYVQVHRSDLQQALLKAATANGVKIQTNCRVIDLNLDQPALILEDRRDIEKDLILAADGNSES